MQIFSEMIEWILVGVVAVLLYISTRKPPNFPPGPPRLPVIGHMVKVSNLYSRVVKVQTSGHMVKVSTLYSHIIKIQTSGHMVKVSILCTHI